MVEPAPAVSAPSVTQGRHCPLTIRMRNKRRGIENLRVQTRRPRYQPLRTNPASRGINPTGYELGAVRGVEPHGLKPGAARGHQLRDARPGTAAGISPPQGYAALSAATSAPHAGACPALPAASATAQKPFSAVAATANYNPGTVRRISPLRCKPGIVRGETRPQRLAQCC
jgi:hypothetical protein